MENMAKVAKPLWQGAFQLKTVAPRKNAGELH